MEVFYYYCNREGRYKSEGALKQQLKTQGTAKIGSQCSADIKAVQNINTYKIQYSYCTTLYNHTTQLAYLQIPLTIQQDIASLDSILQTKVYKHVHLVHKYMQEDKNSISEDPILLVHTYSYFNSYLLFDMKT